MHAKKARYHKSCRRKDHEHHPSNTNSHEGCENTSTGSLSDTRAAYAEGYKTVCDYVDRKILQTERVVRMSMLRNISQTFMQKNFPSFFNPENSVQKLEIKLIDGFNDQLQL